MTDRLYYRNQGLVDFEARIVEVDEQEGRILTFLDQSAFYPTSGGQSHDTGRLNGVEVIDVFESDDGRVAHVTEGPVGDKGAKIHGQVDEDRRWQNRQQHTAQHILSSVFLQLFGAATVSVHLGDDYGAVEFDHAPFSGEQLYRAEEEAFRIMRHDYEVRVLFVDERDTEEIPFRRPPKKEGRLRVIQIGDFEYAACGGTHCDRTGQVGLIKIISLGKLRGHALVHFLSGRQSLRDYRLRFDMTDRMSRVLTCGVEDLSEKLDDLLLQEKNLKQKLSAACRRMLPAVAEEILSRNDETGFVAGVSDLDDNKLNIRLAELIADKTDEPTCLLSADKLIVAAPQNSTLDLEQLARELNARTRLRGGGSTGLVQFGRAERSRFDEYLAIIREFIAGA